MLKRPHGDDDEGCPDLVGDSSDEDEDNDDGDAYDVVLPPVDSNAGPTSISKIKKPKKQHQAQPKTPLQHFMFLVSCCMATYLPSLPSFFSTTDDDDGAADYSTFCNYCCFEEPLTMTEAMRQPDAHL
jgi:hypothetical protein